MRAPGLEVRAGIHTGEVELDKVSGARYRDYVAARVIALAGPGEVLVSAIRHDLLAGSGGDFEDPVERELKGITGSRRVYAAR